MSESTEHWLPVVEYEGLYEVSDLGRVRSLPRRDRRGSQHRGRILKQQVGSYGHTSINMRRNGINKKRWVHQLVAEAFLGRRSDGQEVRHLNGVSADNCVSNLSWGTKSENAYDLVTHGTHFQARKTHCPTGHPYDEENTHFPPRGGRACRACWRRPRA